MNEEKIIKKIEDAKEEILRFLLIAFITMFVLLIIILGYITK